MADEGSPLLSSATSSSSKWIIYLLVGLLLSSFVLIILLGVEVSHTKRIKPPSVASCDASKFPSSYKPYYPQQEEETPESRQRTAVLLRNGTIWTGEGTVLRNYDLLLESGTIREVGEDIRAPAGATIYNLQGAYVTPGLVDMHSHLGVYSYPEDAFGTQDGNELTWPTLPQLRAIDALDPEDPAIPLILQGGITTSLVLPGSGNVMGGQGVFVKLRGGKSVKEMLIPNAPRALKMACGENPKRVYGGKGILPDSRLGVGWRFRQQFFKAAELKQKQDQWDCLSAAGETSSPRPEDLSLEPLVALLRHEAKLMVHCYQVHDLEMMLRTSQEFSFSVTAFHHALEAWKIPDILRPFNLTIATFADNWGFKMEAYDASVWAPKILTDAGISVALKSDHPVIFARYLMHEAAKSHFYGLDEQKALQTVTLNPAKAIGLDNIVGSIHQGKHADIVVWDRYPFSLGAKPNLVFIEGVNYVDNQLPFIPRSAPALAPFNSTGPFACTPSSPLYAIRGVQIYPFSSALPSSIENGTVIVTAGFISCVGSSVDCPIPQGADVYPLPGGVLVPGFVDLFNDLGMVEIPAEAGTSDGFAPDASFVLASEGTRFNVLASRKLSSAWKGGVTTTIAKPMGSNVVTGISAAFFTQGVSLEGSLIKDVTALHIAVGNDARSSSISTEFAELRALFSSPALHPHLAQAVNGTLPVVAFAHSSDTISSLLRLKREFNLTLIILGGAEAHLLAASLAAESVPVILFSRFPPSQFETKQSVENAAAILRTAGVTVALTVDDALFARNLRWEAGFAVANGLSYMDALSSIISVPAQLFGIEDSVRISVGTKANFVAFDGDPLTLDSHVELVGLGSRVDCQPVQY